jgi:hypothetical protein
MHFAEKSVLVFGIYLGMVGTGLIIAPDLVLTPLGFPASTDFWPRVIGAVVLGLAYYYGQAARSGLTTFFRWTVQVRTGIFVIFVALVLLHLAPAPLAALGVVDLLGAAWTGLALRAQARS